MLTKFETRSNRVKGLSFHPKRTWILASLHNGVIQLWDYRMGTLIDRFEEHDAGPVRGIDFHPSQPLFCSGGDDYKIKVWNHKLRRCLFTLLGHLDYIRTVQFHREQPWIVSASDDQTLRIWNWQGRSCISVLTGHNHYVMSAAFHPKDDLVVSASLDQTLRVWDISGLKKQKSSTTELLNVNINQELFGGNDVMVKLILEGHEKGVNWAAFHPTHPLIVSGADDRSIRIWKMDDARGFEIEQLRGHVNNVSCVMYFKDYVISNSEDRSIRVWDVKQRSAIHTFRRDADRFWILAVHPDKNLIAAGHDTGMIVFKLERERPASCMCGNTLYWVKDRQLKSYNFDNSQEEVLVQLRRNTYPPLSLSYCPTEQMALFYYDNDGGTFELYSVPKNGTNADDVKKGFYTAAVFFSRSKFAVLDKTRQVVLRNKNNDILKVLPQIGSADYLFPAANGQVLARADDKVSLFDMSQKRVIGECSASKVKYVVWADDMSRVALLSKHAIVIANRKLKSMCSLHENTRIKSAGFDENGILLYTTLNHLKYCLPTGDTGTIKTLENPIYIVKVAGNVIHYLDREAKVEQMTIDSTEYRFKMALAQHQYHDVLRIVKKTTIYGQSLVAYLQQKSFPEVAMHFVKDNHIRFNLAIECGNLQVAKDTAMELKNPECWRTLADVAMKHGNVQLCELAYQMTNDTDKLLFLYLLTGNREKMQKLLADPSKRSDTSARFQYSLFLGDVEARIKVLEESGQYALAYKVAEAHEMTEKAEALLGALKKALSPEKEAEADEAVAAQLEEQLAEGEFRPPLDLPTPTCVMDSWPILPTEKSFFLRAMEGKKSALDMDEDLGDEEAMPTGGGGWDLDDLDEDDKKEKGGDGEDELQLDDAAGGDVGDWAIDDLGIEDDQEENAADAAAGAGTFYFPNPGRSMQRHWTDNSQLAVDHIAAGAFESAIPLLNRQCGICNVEPLKPFFMAIYAGATGALPVMPLMPAHLFFLNRPVAEGESRRGHLPALCTSLAPLAEKLKAAYQLTTNGKFQEAQTAFRHIIHAVLFVIVDDKNQTGELKELLNISREYTAALRLELTRKECKDAARQLELAAYFTHCNLQPTHLSLTLGAAMSAAFKAKNYKTAAGFAKRLLELNPAAKTSQQARKVIQLAEQNNNTDELSLNYDERNPFVVCAETMKPIYRGKEQIRCSYCYQPYLPACRGHTCAVCLIGTVGGEATGMVNCYSQLR
eukprot:EG_transcript_339